MDGFAETMGPNFEENYRLLVEQLELTMRRIGLHLNGARVTKGPHAELLIMAGFDIGDLAWSNAVLDPAKAEVDHVVRSMDDDLNQAKLEEMRQEYERRRGGTNES